MGQGFSVVTLTAGSAGIDVPELADLSYEKSLGNARFMKSIRARHRDGLVVAKVVMKPWSNLKLDKYVRILLEERRLLAEVPNALGYHRILETSTNGYLVRQYIHSSLYDRMSTRPFLEDIEKKWLAFQLLCAVRDCHARNIFHGNIKTENILVTSWNWLYLTDFSSSFKPTYLPEGNPADFLFFFDTSGRRTCYLAPERFLPDGTQPEGEGTITWAMDIFSVGCVIAELFLETPIFNLHYLFKYRAKDYDLELHLSKIQDDDIREMVLHMMSLEPDSRYSAEEYLNFWRGKAFPDYFYGFLQQYMYSITDPTSGRKPVTSSFENLGESDDRIDKIYNDFDKIVFLLSPENGKGPTKTPQLVRKSDSELFPLCVDIPNYQHQASPMLRRSVDDGTLIFLTIVVSALRGTARASARNRACELLIAFAERTTDEAKLDRIIPYLMGLFVDKSDIVKIAALRSVTQILDLVTVVSPINAYIFPEYILPRLQPFIPGSDKNPSSLVRAAYASCLGTLASTASRYLDMMQALRADGSLPTSDPEAEDDVMSRSSYQTLFDVAREDLVSQFELHTKALLTDTDSGVRRAMLGSVGPLCVFFGSMKVNDVILSHLNTYLNDRDWQLKGAFFGTIVGVAVYVGGPSLEEFILPLMVQSLTDPEEFVVDKVIRSFSSMAELGLFQRSKTWELVDIVGRFTMHPNIWIREAAAHFISVAATYLSVADAHSILVPLIKVYLKVLPSEFSELKLLDSLKKPLPRLVLDMASTWATKSEKGLFWGPTMQQRAFSFGSSEDSIPTISAKELGPKTLSKLPKNDEDEQWLIRLRNAGMGADDEFKFAALSPYIWRAALRRRKDDTNGSPSKFNNIIPLKDLDIIPQTVLFDNDKDVFKRAQTQDQIQEETIPGEDNKPRTLADALLDASTAEDVPRPIRKKGVADARAERMSREGSASRQASTSVLPKLSSSPTEPRSSLDSPSSDVDSRRPSLQIPKVSPRSFDSPIRQSPVGSTAGIILSDHTHTIRHKSSAISLLNPGDNKALPETGTTSANAFGKVDGVSHRDAESRNRQPSLLAAAQEQHRKSPPAIRYKEAHNYTGNDPNVLNLLDGLYLENFPVDEIEFGTQVQPNRRQPIKRRNGQASSAASPWRPEGNLVAMIGEHTAAITRVLTSPDHVFFITGSDDGSVKIWDSFRLERNVSHRSRQTFRLAEGAKVSCLAFVENTYSFICAGTDGSVNVVRVDYSQVQGGTKYGRLKVLREYRLADGEYAVWSGHYRSDNQSILFLATNTSKVIALELRTMAVLYTLTNPLHHGTPTCFCIDRRHHWLLLGTTHGVMDLWDLRFRLRLKAWGFHSASPIHRIVLQPVRSRKSKVYISGGTGQGEITVWDLEKQLCKEVFRTGVSRESLKNMTLIDVDEERAGGMLGRFAMSLEPTGSANVDRGILALAIGAQPPDDGSDPKQFFLITAGPDWKVRYWDTAHHEASMVVSGMDLEEPRPQYTVSQPSQDTIVVTERLSQAQSQQSSTSSARDGSRAPSNTSAKRGNTKPSRSSIISLQQQHLLRSHLDSVLDVALLEYPYGLIISVDRSGVIYVFQ
ncbi:ARM repeat-containing protein [Lepidopterella palustris CBS 459.81]|uniref:non-specific serine/threonine protein kinase n=1 Tax=Lepidopterella palustris CBS 459.81 TaxID=1314670 RepID=A0A8E2JI92_9PEZI|nr:ARM repeat-containing protein [Lepidopterella palustris CBS 459.81]